LIAANAFLSLSLLRKAAANIDETARNVAPSRGKSVRGERLWSLIAILDRSSINSRSGLAFAKKEKQENERASERASDRKLSISKSI